MVDINSISPKEIEKNFETFSNIIISKFKIKDKENFKKDFLEHISRSVKPEYANKEELERLQKENREELDKISDDFFGLISKYAGDVDFYEGASKEIEFLKMARNKR